MGDNLVAGDDVSAAAQADALRPLRQFVGVMQQVLGSDQTYAGTDAQAYNPPRQFVVIGSNGGVAVEGQPIVAASSGGVTLSPVGVLLAIGLAWLVLRKKG